MRPTSRWLWSLTAGPWCSCSTGGRNRWPCGRRPRLPLRPALGGGAGHRPALAHGAHPTMGPHARRSPGAPCCAATTASAPTAPSAADTVDHVVPRSRGGRHEWTNVVAACKRDNLFKGDQLLSELGWTLPFNPGAPEGTSGASATWPMSTRCGSPTWQRPPDRRARASRRSRPSSTSTRSGASAAHRHRAPPRPLGPGAGQHPAAPRWSTGARAGSSRGVGGAPAQWRWRRPAGPRRPLVVRPVGPPARPAVPRRRSGRRRLGGGVVGGRPGGHGVPGVAVHRTQASRHAVAAVVCFAGTGPGEVLRRRPQAHRRGPVALAARGPCSTAFAYHRFDPAPLIDLLAVPAEQRVAVADGPRPLGTGLDALPGPGFSVAELLGLPPRRPPPGTVGWCGCTGHPGCPAAAAVRPGAPPAQSGPAPIAPPPRSRRLTRRAPRPWDPRPRPARGTPECRRVMGAKWGNV